jgi:hypothetical protein
VFKVPPHYYRLRFTVQHTLLIKKANSVSALLTPSMGGKIIGMLIALLLFGSRRFGNGMQSSLELPLYENESCNSLLCKWRTQMKILLSLFAALVLLVGCEVEQTEEGEMPDVSVEGGNLPEYDVDAPDVDVSTEERTITVPTVDVEPADSPQDDDR